MPRSPLRRAIVSPAVSDTIGAPAPRQVTHPLADAVLPDRAPGAPAPGSPVPSHYRLCFGCGPEHPRGMHLQVTAGDDLDVRATFRVTEEHQGAPGLAHGGVLVTAMDDTFGALHWLLATPAVTARLDTTFRRPVPVGSVLHLHARITGTLGRRVYLRGEGHLDAVEGPVAITATALFVQVPLEHFVTHGRAEDVERAREDAQVGRYLEHLEVSP